MKKFPLIILSAKMLVLLFGCGSRSATENRAKPIAGIHEKTPSQAMYFDWINADWLGSNENKVAANLDFFKWMKDEYGMQLDIYHWDAGNIDRSPSWIPEESDWNMALKSAYGSFGSKHFKSKYPNGLKPLVKRADEIGTRFGVWLGPDGWGETEFDAVKRKDLLVSLCRDYNLQLFKFDAAVTGIRPEKEKYLVEALTECRKYTPDLIALNHRIELSKDAEKLMTTWLWEGRETYIDVHIWNEVTAPHHRAGALSRGLPPRLSRLTEDHGVCISSCLDYWQDDLILQAFNRNLILAPEIYGNPWLLRDDEFAELARIYNVHRKFNEILVNGTLLPEKRYGPYAISRGNASTRLLTLRNLTWNNKKVDINLTNEIGIEGNQKLLVKTLHPTEKVIGIYEAGQIASIEIAPFRSSLVLITTDFKNEFSLEGTDYKVIKEVPGRPVEISLLGWPGESKAISINNGRYKFKSAVLDGKPIQDFDSHKAFNVRFDGEQLKNNYHRKLGSFSRINIPGDWKALYEATCFTADNNALEVRSLQRSGPSSIPQVEKARAMFFNDPIFRNKGIWDKYAFDSDISTSFKVRDYKLKDVQVKPGALRINFGKSILIDKIVLKQVTDTNHISKAEVSDNLGQWKSLAVNKQGNDLVIIFDSAQRLQFVRIDNTPLSISEIEAYVGGNRIPATDTWQISNLFPSNANLKVRSCWRSEFILDEIANNSYLCVAIPGNYGNEGVWAALKIDGKYVGAPDRSPSFVSNHWEHVVKDVDGNYTYYFPLTHSVKGKKIEAYVLGISEQSKEIKPEVWITSYPIPFESKRLILY